MNQFREKSDSFPVTLDPAVGPLKALYAAKLSETDWKI